MAIPKMVNPFIKASTKKKYLKIAVYGPPGVGKTWFGLTFPSPAVIDLEGGTDFYADRFQFSVMDTKSFAEVLSAVEFLETGQHEFKTLVIDPITIIWSSLQDGRLEFKVNDVDKAISGEEKTSFNYQDWGQMKRFYSLLMTKLVNLNMHVVMVGRQKDEYDIKKGGEMIKIGVKLDGEKSTTYLPDIYFRLESDKSGKRFAVFEKDRSGTFQEGQRVEGISFESFSGLVEKASHGTSVATHQSEEDAINKDAAFFQARETRPSERQIRDNSNKGINAPTVQNLFTWLGALSLPNDYDLRYKQYCYKKYSVKSMTELTTEQIQEQRVILTNAMNIESNKKALSDHLAGYNIPEDSQQMNPSPTESFSTITKEQLPDMDDQPWAGERFNQDAQPAASAVGNGKEKLTRSKIRGKLEAIFPKNQDDQNGWLDDHFSVTVDGLDALNIESLQPILDSMDKLFNGRTEQ
ncbi:MAG: ATP-binding protein [Nanoarchaeota archaeon]|nr:ATP-binding protein [Nanoarchaeota archaeon]MBU0977836.1 ATP-binding protein [Nanoarchaeota archaeon]